jgi:hypothetical protein
LNQFGAKTQKLKNKSEKNRKRKEENKTKIEKGLEETFWPRSGSGPWPTRDQYQNGNPLSPFPL